VEIRPSPALAKFLARFGDASATAVRSVNYV